MERANFNLKVKSVDEAGKFTGVGAVFGNVDLGGDRIIPGAFARTLAGGRQYPLLWQHDPSQPIGTFKATETQQGLMIEGQLLLSDPTGAKAHNLLKNQVIKGLSIGYDTIRDQMVGDVRELIELRLWECSIVTFPMNESAMITNLKGMSSDDLSRRLKSIGQHQQAIDRHTKAIREHLKAMLGDDSDDLALIDDDEGDDEDMTQAFVIEVRKLVEQTSTLTAS